jgi:hypothetical protein
MARLDSDHQLKRFSKHSRRRKVARAGGQRTSQPLQVAGAVNKSRSATGLNDLKVLELVPGKRVSWRCVDGAPEWIGTELSFDLSQDTGSRVVLFSTTRLERAD